MNPEEWTRYLEKFRDVGPCDPNVRCDKCHEMGEVRMLEHALSAGAFCCAYLCKSCLIELDMSW